MKKATKAAIFVTAAAALYGAAAYGVTRTLMDVAMKREAPKALKNKGSAQLTGEKRDEPYREAQRAAAKKLASSSTGQTGQPNASPACPFTLWACRSAGRRCSWPQAIFSPPRCTA